MLRKGLIKAIIPSIITGVISIYSWTYPSVFMGAIIYSILVDTIPYHSTKSIFFSYLKHCFMYVLTGITGWLNFILWMFHNLDFSFLSFPALFSIIYYHILLFINQFTD
jgi:hypothetical protein